MNISAKHVYPNLTKQFTDRGELARLIFRSEKTVSRSLSGKRPFDEYEIRRMEEYTRLPRVYLLKRRNEK